MDRAAPRQGFDAYNRLGSVLISGFIAVLVYQQFYGSGSTARQVPLSASHALDGTTPRVYAIADIHGDFPRALSALQHARVVDEHGAWQAGNATLVQTGDIVDRGPDTRLLYQYFRNLTSQAVAHGGKVVKLWGNHEYMNAMYDWRYVDSGDLASFPKPSKQNREIAFSSDGDIGKDWMVDYAVTYRHPTYRAHFMHAGLNAEHAKNPTNHIGKEFMTDILSGKRSHSAWRDVHKRFWSEDGPMWYRGYALLEESQACAVAHEVMQILDVDFLVMGHTPNFDGALSRCGGHVLLIDTGLSGAYGGRPVVLEFYTTNHGAREAKFWYDDDHPSSEIVYRDQLAH